MTASHALAFLSRYSRAKAEFTARSSVAGARIALALVGMSVPSFVTVRADTISVFGSPGYAPETAGYRYGAGVPFPGGPVVNNAGLAIGNPQFEDPVNGGGGVIRTVWWSGSGITGPLSDLGSPERATAETFAWSINQPGYAAGQSTKYRNVGTFTVSNGWRPVRWSPDGSAVELATLGTGTDGYTEAFAIAINDSNIVVGSETLYNASGQFLGVRAIRWSPDGTAVELPSLVVSPSGSKQSRPVAINNRGEVAGWSSKPFAGNFPVRWSAAGVASELAVLGKDVRGETQALPSSINDAGRIVGYVHKYEVAGKPLGPRAVAWEPDGSLTELELLGTDADGATQANAVAINENGVSTGYAYRYDASGVLKGSRAVRWDRTGHAEELGLLGVGSDGWAWSDAHDINAGGTVVGSLYRYNAGISANNPSAVYWGADGLAIDLNTLIDPSSGWQLNVAIGISDTGWIVGNGRYDPDGPSGEPANDRMFVIHVPAAVPEPGTAGVVLAAMCAGLGVRPRRQR
ncbi:MAG: hypothetical protein ACAI43_04735 [Phycisphaerae bacterium]